MRRDRCIGTLMLSLLFVGMFIWFAVDFGLLMACMVLGR